jgi:hypothetical protein
MEYENVPSHINGLKFRNLFNKPFGEITIEAIKAAVIK